VPQQIGFTLTPVTAEFCAYWRKTQIIAFFKKAKNDEQPNMQGVRRTSCIDIVNMAIIE
jgi:hypothetical protein